MATLVLSTVGRMFGGPVGQILGAAAGQAIDRDVLFRASPRQGPRLTDLSVQTSSYGTPIQWVFGTMRVAGSVIWSTDLIESHATSHPKGQAGTTTYSYAVSFAVALSGRPIVDVGRIWADGNLLRGRAGDFKTATGFRLHAGGEDQPPDPLIASAEGALAPAHRGIAYAVFENFALGDYGNRIPSLTFEVIADAAPVAAGAMAAELTGGIVAGAGAGLPGFAAYGDTRAVLETLAGATGAWFASVGAGLVLSDTVVAGETLDDAGYAAGGSAAGATATRSIAAIETVPRTLSLAHYDPARDYQTGVQRARRPGAGQAEQRLEMPAALSADAAKAMAEAALARAEAGREHRTLALGWNRIGIAPGSCVSIAGAAGRWRVTGWSLEHMVLTLTCVKLASVTAPAAVATSGRVLPAPDLLAGTTRVHAFETPALDDALRDRPRLTIAAAGTGAGWRSAALLYSIDDGARWISAGATPAPATLGALATVPAAGTALLFDTANWFEVDLLHAAMALAGADDGALDAGANLALVGDELLQFGVATQIGATRWRLSRLVRGRRGTEAAIGTQAAGDRFVLLTADTATTIDLPLATLGAQVRVLASGSGDTAGPAASDAMIGGASVVPPSPVHAKVAKSAGGGAAISWVRRSRSGWRWIDGVDSPLGEERELYRVTLRTPAGAVRVIEVAEPMVEVAAAERAGGCRVEIRQVGALGESLPAILELDEEDGE